jgi:RNA polymerase sigma-70 factor (ECF subfamily)
MAHEPIPPDPDRHDKALMVRVADGDQAAFRELVVRYQRTIHALAFRYLGSAADAEEIAQETFCRLFQAAPRYRAEPGATFRTYLLRIATNLCTNRKARAYRSHEEGRDFAIVDQGASDGGDPRKELLAARLSEAVRAAVATLPDDQRMDIILFRFDNLSYEEIAVATGRSVSAVTSSLWRARTALREALAPWMAPAGRTQDVAPRPVDSLEQASGSAPEPAPEGQHRSRSKP